MSQDDAVLDPGFSTTAVSRCFSPPAHVQAMLQVEGALALSCAEAGVGDQVVAEEIARICATVQLDARQILSDGWQLGTPVLALRSALVLHLSDEAARDVAAGHGATTQDIVDTAFQLQIREALGAIEADLTSLNQRLIELALEHRTTPMIGRTFMQHARPTTFGLRAAHWYDAAASIADALRSARTMCSIQLGGPVGTLEGLGTSGPDVTWRFAERLGLRQPVASWHGDRRRVADVCALVGQTARCMAKMATDIAILSSSEIGEVRVRAGGSSSMAGKRNPFDAVRALSAADACAGAAALVSTARPIELERGLGGWHVEWLAVPLTFMTGAASVEAMARSLESLEVDQPAMLRNLGDLDTTDTNDLAAQTVDRIVAYHRANHGR
jgi:3-carboxy-cis,cis-muconate cycloisomerase